MELQGVRRGVVVAAAVVALLAPAAASAALTTTTDPNTPVQVNSENAPPKGYRLTGAKVRRIAARDPRIRDELRRHPKAVPYEYTKGPGRWQVSWFSSGRNEKELAQVYVDDATGRVTEAWTGFQVPWAMARGYDGAFGRRVNAWYVWLPLCLLFVAPFIPGRRRGPRPSLLHLDLLMLLGFSISLAFFNHALIGLSVPLAYPFLCYLLVRMLFVARGRGIPREPLRLFVPAGWLAIAVVFLVGFRVGLNVTNSNVIDVGYAGVIGADKLLHGKPIYGNWPHDNANGDTYGPVNYYAYVPFKLLFGWSGRWDDLPAVHAAAIVFDLLTLLGLYFLGRRVRGPTLGIVLAYAWASYPFSIYALSSNSNDTLVSLIVVAAMLALTYRPASRVASGGKATLTGAATALAGLAKFAPLALGPLFLRGTGRRPSMGSAALYTMAFALAAALVMLPVLLHHNLHAFWSDTVSYQASRGSPFSIWGLWGGLSLEQHLVQGAGVALGIAVAFLPRGPRTPVQVAALAAAALIAVELGVTHWFYLYIVWFFPLVMVALLGRYPGPEEALPEEAIAVEQPPVPVGAGS